RTADVASTDHGGARPHDRRAGVVVAPDSSSAAVTTPWPPRPWMRTANTASPTATAVSVVTHRTLGELIGAPFFPVCCPHHSPRAPSRAGPECPSGPRRSALPWRHARGARCVQEREETPWTPPR